jgi:hypothetical protein
LFSIHPVSEEIGYHKEKERKNEIKEERKKEENGEETVLI